jgi:hypothetical protein
MARYCLCSRPKLPVNLHHWTALISLAPQCCFHSCSCCSASLLFVVRLVFVFTLFSDLDFVLAAIIPQSGSSYRGTISALAMSSAFPATVISMLCSTVCSLPVYQCYPCSYCTVVVHVVCAPCHPLTISGHHEDGRFWSRPLLAALHSSLRDGPLLVIIHWPHFLLLLGRSSLKSTRTCLQHRFPSMPSLSLWLICCSFSSL